ncbi:hypothetical protein [Ichthyenterobacterium magnum]|uniref:Uncharacterized protein n=1 Tax=Ichthyenterobacterium magnum TaxID=1230530 RepID=A0A420DUS4_9FLAO|nr:hypothetical protein [Ichthyenterobacterium magnum]RKE98051.1 hypothetical protein BXY80_0116 [Ichthyenterobacterium magnum]
MKANEDKNLDLFTKKIMKQASIESPSFDFTDVVMSQVNALKESKAIVYKPLISKTSWLFILIAVVTLTTYLVFGIESKTPEWLSTLDFSIISNNKMVDAFSGLSFSNTLVYAVAFFGLMFFVQITFLKQNFDKHFEV